MNARARVEDDAALPEPITTPPPAGAADMYSAPTRVSTLPEDVLGDSVDHFRKDTFRLACAVYTILFLRPPSRLLKK